MIVFVGFFISKISIKVKSFIQSSLKLSMQDGVKVMQVFAQRWHAIKDRILPKQSADLIQT